VCVATFNFLYWLCFSYDMDDAIVTFPIEWTSWCICFLGWSRQTA